MLITSILLPVLVLILPIQDMVMDDLRTTRPASLPLVVGHHRRGAITGIVVTSVFVGHRLFYSDALRNSLGPKDVPATRPPQYVEDRLSRPYTSVLLRTQCIAQKIPTPPAPTCINKAVNPSFEYAEKSPVPPTLLGRPRVCSLQPTQVFIGNSMTFLHPATSPNVLLFPEPARHMISSPRFGLLSTPTSVMVAALIAIGVWAGLAVLILFGLSVDNSAEVRQDDGIELIMSCSDSENGQGEGLNKAVDSALGCSGEILASGYQARERDPTSPALSAPRTETSTGSSLTWGLPVPAAGELVLSCTAEPSQANNAAHSVGPELCSVSPDTQGSDIVSPPNCESPMLLLPDPVAVTSSSPLLPNPTPRSDSPERPPVVLESSLPAPCENGFHGGATLLSAATVPPSVLNPTATAFIPRSLGSSIHATAPEKGLPILDVSHAPEARSLRSSIHAPAPNLDVSDQDSRSLQSSARALGPGRNIRALDTRPKPKSRSSKSSVYAPAPEQRISGPNAPDTSKARWLRLPVHIPGPERKIPALAVPHPAKDRSLGASIHAPAPERRIPISGAPHTPVARMPQPSIQPALERNNSILGIPDAPNAPSLSSPVRVASAERSTSVLDIVEVSEPRSLRSSIHAPGPEHNDSVLDSPHASKARSLCLSIHAPGPERNILVADTRPNHKQRSLRTLQSTIHTPGPERNVSVLDSPHASNTRSLHSSIHAPGPERNTPVVDARPASGMRSLRSSRHAPAIERTLSVIDIPDAPEDRSLQSSIHATVPRPVQHGSTAVKPRPALNPAARAYTTGAPKFFAQSHRPAVVIAPPPPKEHRFRSQQMSEGKRMKREARWAVREGGATGM